MSFRRRLLKLFVLSWVLIAVVVLSACQPAIVFVVANESNDRIDVRYVVKRRGGENTPAALPDTMAVKPVSELGERTAWHDLPETRFKFTPETGTVVLTLLPKEALRLQRTGFSCDEPDPRRAEYFAIQELNIIGPSGVIRLTGEQARRSFISGPRGVCALTYR